MTFTERVEQVADDLATANPPQSEVQSLGQMVQAMCLVLDEVFPPLGAPGEPTIASSVARSVANIGREASGETPPAIREPNSRKRLP